MAGRAIWMHAESVRRKMREAQAGSPTPFGFSRLSWMCT